MCAGVWEISWDCASFLGIDCGGEWVLCTVLWCTWSTGIRFCSSRSVSFFCFFLGTKWEPDGKIECVPSESVGCVHNGVLSMYL